MTKEEEMELKVIDLLLESATIKINFAQHDIHVVAGRIVKLFAIPCVTNSVCDCGYPNSHAGYKTNWKMVCSNCGLPKAK